MSKHALTHFDKINLYKLKPQTRTILQTLKSQTNNKQNLRDVIMDYIIRKLFKENSRDKAKLFKVNNNLKRIPIQLSVQINGQRRTVQVNGYHVLEKYVEFQRKNVYKQNSIEPLVVEILNFFDQMQEICDSINFQIRDEVDPSNTIINILLQKYNKDRQRNNRIKQLDMIKHKTVAKYTRVSYLDIENKLEKKECQIYVEKNIDSSHRVSRDTISSSVTDKQLTATSSQTKQMKNSKSKLKDVVDKFKVFEHPQKIQQLRLEKLNEIYDAVQVEKVTETTKAQKQSSPVKKKPSDPNQEYLQFLENWISQISASERLFRLKMQQKQNRQKQNEVHVGKIIEESSDQDNKSIDGQRHS